MERLSAVTLPLERRCLNFQPRRQIKTHLSMVRPLLGTQLHTKHWNDTRRSRTRGTMQASAQNYLYLVPGTRVNQIISSFLEVKDLRTSTGAAMRAVWVAMCQMLKTGAGLGKTGLDSMVNTSVQNQPSNRPRTFVHNNMNQYDLSGQRSDPNLHT